MGRRKVERGRDRDRGREFETEKTVFLLPPNQSWASSPLGNPDPRSQPPPSALCSPATHLPWRSWFTTVSLRPIVFTTSSVQCGTRFRTWEIVAFVIHFSYSLMSNLRAESRLSCPFPTAPGPGAGSAHRMGGGRRVRRASRAAFCRQTLRTPNPALW